MTEPSEARVGGSGHDDVHRGRADDQLSGSAGGTDTCSGNKQNSADATCELIFGVP
jgi:hypothetical protein